MGSFFRFRLVRAYIHLLAWLYPIAIWFLHDDSTFKPLTWVFLALMLGYFFIALASEHRLLVFALVAALASILGFLNPDHLARLYPFLMSTSLLLLFLRPSAPADNPLLAPLCRFLQPDPELLVTLHRFKSIWIVGLLINSGILFGFLFGFSTELWALYASFYAYLLLAFIFALTFLSVWLVRRRLW